MDVRQVGNPDPNWSTSPIIGFYEADEAIAGLGGQPAGQFCLFSGEGFPHGAEIQSGAVRLRCERGHWVVVGAREARSDTGH